MKLPIYQVDAFTDRVFSGNPAAVCPLEAWPDDALMQSIALENNLSETAFFVRANDGYELRWFTPLTEVPLCGHATLASAYVILEHLDPSADRVRFEPRKVGPLTVHRDGDRYAMDLPAQPSAPAEVDDDLVLALGGARPVEVHHGYKWVARFEREAQVADLAPDFARLAKLEAQGLIATAPGDEVDFVSRFFAPRAGVDEDPVTGSAHTVLTPYWAARLGRTSLSARQISRRGGRIDCVLEGDRVVLRGKAVLYLTGTIEV